MPRVSPLSCALKNGQRRQHTHPVARCPHHGSANFPGHSKTRETVGAFPGRWEGPAAASAAWSPPSRGASQGSPLPPQVHGGRSPQRRSTLGSQDPTPQLRPAASWGEGTWASGWRSAGRLAHWPLPWGGRCRPQSRTRTQAPRAIEAPRSSGARGGEGRGWGQQPGLKSRWKLEDRTGGDSPRGYVRASLCGLTENSAVTRRGATRLRGPPTEMPLRPTGRGVCAEPGVWRRPGRGDRGLGGQGSRQSGPVRPRPPQRHARACGGPERALVPAELRPGTLGRTLGGERGPPPTGRG